MTSLEDRTEFLSDPIRLEIAEFCRSEPRSLGEIASKLGRPSGSLSQPETMRRKGALRRRARGRGDKRRRVRAFSVAPSWIPALDKAKARRRPETPPDGQELLLIPLAQTPRACEALAAGIQGISWAAELSGESVGLLIAPTPDDKGAYAVRVLRALGAAGQETRRLHLRSVLSPAELREWSIEVTSEAEPAKSLPTGE